MYCRCPWALTFHLARSRHRNYSYGACNPVTCSSAFAEICTWIANNENLRSLSISTDFHHLPFKNLLFIRGRKLFWWLAELGAWNWIFDRTTEGTPAVKCTKCTILHIRAQYLHLNCARLTRICEKNIVIVSRFSKIPALLNCSLRLGICYRCVKKASYTAQQLVTPKSCGFIL